MIGVTFFVPGLVPAQGSGRAVTNKHTGRAVYLPSNADKLARFRADVRVSVTDAGWLDKDLIESAVGVSAQIYVPRPKSHYGTGRNAHVVKDSAPAYPVGKPDIDKQARALNDALVSAGVLYDDTQVVELSVTRAYADTHAVGVRVLVFEYGSQAVSTGAVRHEGAAMVAGG